MCEANDNMGYDSYYECVENFYAYLYCSVYYCEPEGYTKCVCPDGYTYNSSGDYFSNFSSYSGSDLYNVFGIPFDSSQSTSFTFSPDEKWQFGCLTSVSDDITITGTSATYKIPQAKMIAKEANAYRMGNFLGLGRPVAENFYMEAETTYSYYFYTANDYN